MFQISTELIQSRTADTRIKTSVGNNNEALVKCNLYWKFTYWTSNNLNLGLKLITWQSITAWENSPSSYTSDLTIDY